MTTWLRAALAAQLLFFGAWGGKLMTSHVDGTIVWLSTEPVDPRDLLSGNYVAMRYRIASATTAYCEGNSTPGTAVWVQLAPVGEPVMTAEGRVVPWESVGCLADRPYYVSGAVWVAGRRDEHDRIIYGIERMFVGEENPLRNARSGTVIAKVAVNKQHEPRLLAVVTKETTTAVAP